MSTPKNTPDNTLCKCVKIQIQKKKMDKQTKKNLIIAGSVIGSAVVITAVTLGLVYGLTDSTKKEIKDKANTMMEDAKNSVEHVKEKVEPIIQDIKEAVKEKKNQGNDMIKDVKDAVEKKKSKGMI